MKRQQIIPNHLQLERLIELIRPIRNKIRWVLEGNHCKRITKLVGIDYLKDGLMPHLKNAVFLGYEGFVRYIGDKNESHLLYLHHGSGGSMTTHHLLDKAVKNGLDVADAIIISHGHKSDVTKYTRWKETHFQIVPRTVYGIRTGSYMKHAQYAKDAIYTGGDVGEITLKLTTDMEVLWK